MLKKMLIGFLCILLSACAHQQKSLKVALDWFINPDHAPLFVAEHDGFFKQEGLNVNILNLSDPSDGPKLVAANKADIALTYEPELLIMQSKGLPLQQIGTLVNQPLDCLSVLASSSIDSIADLRDKKIGLSGSAVNHLLQQSMLNFNRLSLKDVQLINVRYNLTSALLSKNVNAVNGFMRNVEPIQMKLLGHPTRNFYPEDNGVPPYAELIWVSHASPSAEQQQEFEKFLQALTQATAYLKAHPEETWKEFAASYPQLNTPAKHASWLETVHYFDDHPAVLDLAQTKRFKMFMQQALI